MSYIKNYHEACDALYPHLREYLEEHNINTTSNFCCINPDHDDHNPSMGIAPSGKAFMCFSCGFSGGIFHAAHILEKKPMVGQEFLQENLMYLAEKYGVDVETEPLTEEQIYKYDTYRAYRSAAELVRNEKSSKQFDNAIGQRGWTRETCKEYGVGCVPDYKEFRESLKRLGFSASFLDDIDLGRKEIFGEDRLVFTIRDAHERPVGFASRNLGYTDDKQNGAKYVNQKGTGLKCNIYKKSTRLFGLDRVLASRDKTTQAVYIFEGYSDVVTAAQHGIRNTVAVGSATLTAEQVNLLKEHHCYNLVLCFDGDATGRERTANMLDTVLSGHKDLRVHIIVMPNGSDPDSFIREYGAAKFTMLKHWSAFEWRLSQFPEDTDAEVICDSMIPLIVNESSHISQEKMCNVLAKNTGITLKTIQQELERLQNAKSHEKSRDRQAVLDKLVRELQKSPEEAEEAIHHAETKLFDLAKQYDDDAFSEESCLGELDQQKIVEEEKDGSFSGFLLGSELALLEKYLNGQWRKDVWLTFGGKPNCFPVDTKFMDPKTGAIVTARELSVVNSYNEKHEIIHAKPVSYIPGESKECFEVTVERGYKITTSADHRYLTKNGYKKLSELSVGDAVAQPSCLRFNFQQAKSQDLDRGVFLGLMIGDGNYTQPRPLFTNDDPQVLAYIETQVERFFPGMQMQTYQTKSDNPDYRMVGFTQKDWKTNRDNNGYCYPNPITEWFKDLGIYGQCKEHKELPKSVFTSSSKFIAGVLSGLFTSDGSIYQNKDKNGYTKTTIEFCTISEKLARQVQHLLLRFDINAGLSFKRNEKKGAWIVKFSNKRKLSNFAHCIGFGGRKQNRLNRWVDTSQYYEPQYIEWGKIKSIESVGYKECCDIEVQDTHNFCVDGFVLHNSGKTSFLCKLAHAIAKQEENNACVIYHSIDDTMEQVRPKFIAIAEGSRKLSINAITDPNYHKRNSPDLNIDERREEGYQGIRELIEDGRLILKDANHGMSLSFADRLIHYYKTRYPDRNIVYILDNFHKLQDFKGGGNEERIRVKDMSTSMKGLATKHHICVITTVEYRKTQNNAKAGNQDIAESIQIEYDANLIAHVHNELHEKKSKAKLYHLETIDSEPINCPTIEIEIGKNKITSFKNSLYFDFFPHCSDFISVSEQQISYRQEQNKGDEVDEKESELF